MQPTWKEPMSTPEGKLLQVVKAIEVNLGISKNKYCMNCEDTSCKGCSTADYKSDRGEKASPKLPKPKGKKSFGKNKYCMNCEDTSCVGCKPSSKDIDKTTEFLRSKGIMTKYDTPTPSGAKGPYQDEEDPNKKMPFGGNKPSSPNPARDKPADPYNPTGAPQETPYNDPSLNKWEQEPSVENAVPTFMDHSGGVPVEAINYHTNQTYPDYQDKAPKSTFISEKAQIPSVAQTGYDEKGSSLHMHLNDGGSSDYRAPIEESMMNLKKAGVGNPGLMEEIASEVERLMGRLL